MKETLIKQALIMAAGRGNRMRPLTDTLPKPMVPYNGDTLIGNSLTRLHDCVEKIHVTVGYKKAMLSEYLMTRGVDTIINTEGHGNAWWVSKSVMKYVNEPVLVLTTDNIIEINIEFLNDSYHDLGCPPCMVVPVNPIPGIYGDYIEEKKGHVISLQRDIPQPTYCSGIQVLNPEMLCTLMGETEDFNHLWQQLIECNLLFASTIYPNDWYSVDTLEQLAFVNDKSIRRLKDGA